MVAQWLVVGLTIKRSQVRDQARTWLGYNFGQVVHTHVPLSPSSIIWYRRKPGHEQAYHAMHWPHVHGMLVSGWGLQKQRSAPPYGPMWLGEDFTYLAFDKLMVVLMSQCCSGIAALSSLLSQLSIQSANSSRLSDDLSSLLAGLVPDSVSSESTTLHSTAAELLSSM